MKVIPNEYIVIQNALLKGKKTEQLYPADQNDLEIKRGAVGMRIQGSEKTVKSQFYILLDNKLPSDKLFSYVFGYVTEGLEVCDDISTNLSIVDQMFVADVGQISLIDI